MRDIPYNTRVLLYSYIKESRRKRGRETKAGQSDVTLKAEDG